MLLAILSGIAAGAAGGVYGFRDGSGLWEKLSEMAFFAVVAGFLTGLLIGVLAAVIGQVLPTQWVRLRATKLVSLSNGTGVHGSFFLGTGTLNSEPIFQYFYPLESGGFKSATLQGDVTVFEEDREDGEKVNFGLDFKWGWLWIFAICQEQYRYEFHIPKGSITKAFELK